MRSFRFLLSRRWALFAAAIALVAYVTWWLGNWQFSRLDERQDSNAVIRANETRDPAPVAEVMPPDGEVAEDDEWRLVTATGTYRAEDTIVVRYRTRDGAPGIDVVVPLQTSQGPVLLVDRGWLQTDPRGGDRGDLPDPPAGEVTVVGWARADGTGDSTAVRDLSTRAVDSDRIGEALGVPTYDGFVELKSENGAPAEGLSPVELPELDNGPHFFYGLQWWFFGLLALGGFGYLLYVEWRDQRRAARRPEPGAAPGQERQASETRSA